MKRVLVTGGRGFVGRAATSALLRAGFEVHVADLHGGDVPGANVHAVDLLDGASMRGLLHLVRPTHILHLAWYAKPGLYWTSPLNLRWVEASLDLARAFADLGGGRLVVVGSCAEYDWHHGFFSEDVTPLAPATLYGVSKDALRRILSSFAPANGISLAWARLFYLYGPHEAANRLVSGACASLLAGAPTRTTAGTQLRDFMHIEDVGLALSTVLDSNFSGAVNVASGEPTTIRGIVTRLAEVAGHPELAKFGDLPMNPSDPSVILADVRKLAALGFRPTFSLEAGLADTYAWWRDNAAT